ncbi:LysR family transcriptional regulator [Klebsiella grimontii]|uniref:LysR family transcriptional regulator n=1 Tax=Klebsiella grimontii TaxID=2058152 RepID=UPI001AE24627|nr:LysR family transcriptional regulator [Klebsiella grimontii]MDG9848817.1 LysR family transcriptional regulator [Klebsiella grimontii]MDG9963734.1 LysR family transcriptional regulator [Klebsiella grimontii]QTP46538.1 LysR family transcriptional regulator [Klebsiella grimontii]
MHKTTLEQWALLEKVVELGSFAKAADETHRSQSSVSYNLALLQERLGVTLLTPSGRRAVLTPAGELLLGQVKPLLQAFAYVETHAATLRDGARTRLDLVVDSIFPRERLFAILRQFQQRYPQTQVRLTEVLENVEEELPARSEADVMVLTRRQDITGRGEWLMNIDFVAVAHRDHPLSALEGPLDDNALAPWPLVRIADRGNDPQSARDAWTFSTIDAAIDAVLYQVGFGWLPEARIRPQLQQGVLKALPLGHGARRATPLHLIVKRDLTPIDEQVATLLDLFRTP